MNRELLIIVYKINVGGYTAMHANEAIHRCIEDFSLRNDEELKEKYIIREIFIPIDGESDVRVIYPIASSSHDVRDLINEINNKMSNEHISEDFKKSWKQLLRELKINSLETTII